MNCGILTGFVAAAALSGCVSVPKPPDLSKNPRTPNPRTGNFWWGVSTSSYQTEDPAVKPGDPDYFQTDWDLYVERGGAPPKGNATYSWTHFDKDLEAIKKLGISHFRLSLEWARIQPTPDTWNEEAIAEYVRRVKKLKSIGVEPVVALWHFTFPSWAHNPKNPKLSSWLNPQIEEGWDRYVRRMVKELSPYVRIWAPQNEPNGDLATQYLGGQWPPATIADIPLYDEALAASVKQFRDAARIIKEIRPDAWVISIAALPYWEKSIFDPGNQYYNEMQQVNFDHLDRVYDVCDIIGWNYYYSQPATVLYYLIEPFERGPKFSDCGWRINPEAFAKQIRIVAERYGKPMAITENGIAARDSDKKIAYIKAHTDKVLEAKRAGIDIRGYFLWTLVDDYEWHFGYGNGSAYGLFQMDPKTLNRIPYKAAAFYKDLVAKNKRLK